MYVTFPYGLQPASSGLANQEHVLAPHHSPSDILDSSNQHIWPYQMVSKFTNVPLQRSTLFTNGFIIITYMSFVEPASVPQTALTTH